MSLNAPQFNHLYVIENNLLKATFSSLGASLVSLIYKPLSRETVCGFLSLDQLKKQTFYLGAVVGRVANRIDHGHFTLNQHTYELAQNNGVHHLHGGTHGFNEAIFEVEASALSLIFKHTSPHLDEGYPGTLQLSVKYLLVDEALSIEMQATSDQDTLSDPTLHTYFNLNANHAQTIRNHHLSLQAKSLYGLSESGCTENKRFDASDLGYKESVQIDEILKTSHPQLELAKGIDHYFIKQDPSIEHFATLSVEDLSLVVESTHPGAHIYSGNYLESSDDLKADFLQENGGICFETHHVPNSINFDLSLAPILKAHTQQTSKTLYRFKGV